MNQFVIQTMPASRVAQLVREWSPVIVPVVLAHATLLWFWVALPDHAGTARQDMAISLSIYNQMQKVESPAAVKPRPEAKASPIEPRQTENPAPDVEASPPPVAENKPSTQSALDSPGQPDREPDYQAAYLNNPAPVYPLVARRMGWQGKVVLNVEVLESGLPGQIMLQQSSGHDVLDNAALNSVRTWRFVPARHGGEPVARRFLVPIPFILHEDM